MTTPRLMRQQQILRLHIPMNHILRMHIHQRTRHLPHNPRRLLLRQRPLLHHIIKQLPPAHELHNDVNLILRDVDIVELDNVGMLERAEGFDFGVELIHHVLEFGVDFELVDDFAGAGGAGGDFDAAVAGGGGADAEDFAEFVLLVEFGFGILSIIYLSRRLLLLKLHPSCTTTTSLLFTRKHSTLLLLQPTIFRTSRITILLR
mmetsp:Transcript_42046/g.75808  ORF Transcript_42046/g.75808 Transcript_42046/m.75808 type:complete len:204 (+) Transcript_42046:819-1430(+)